MENINWNSLLFQFDGRINRGKFWLGTVIIWVAYVVFVVIAAAADLALVYTLVLLLIWPGLARCRSSVGTTATSPGGGS